MTVWGSWTSTSSSGRRFQSDAAAALAGSMTGVR